MSDPRAGKPADDRPAAETTPAASAEASARLEQAIAGAARRVGADPSADAPTHQVVWGAIGGWRGIAESILPSLVFVVVFTIWQNLPAALGASVGLAVVFTVVRFAQRQPASAALGGLIAAAAAAALALWTGRAADNFLWGIVTNSIYGVAFLVSALIGWSLIGLAVGFLMGEGTAWRSQPRKRRAFFWLTIAWAGLFAARLAVQLPIYLSAIASGDPDAGATALGAVRIAMGLPLFAPLVAVTWLVVRALYRPTEAIAPDRDAGAEPAP